VSRAIAVADAARSAAFYRDVLGFDINESPDGSEASNGPALLRFDASGPGPAIVFFETNDVDAMHGAIRASGGETGEIAKVNWIKMRMFEIRDPDGNNFWFGQSFDKPDGVPPAAMLHKALSRLPLTDIPGSDSMPCRRTKAAATCSPFRGRR
jgi:catechol 2,3-dioxygenase-like lactoylglutathione lyase family enzyme